LCITRTTFDWGIPVPFDPKHVVYVWFDALLNYLTGIKYGVDDAFFKRFWPADLHLVGKEIVRFHSIIWPIMLHAMGVEMPKKVYGHGWLVVDGTKMSKSLGNVIDPLGLIDEFGSDAIRYFLLREINLGHDGNFNRDALIQRTNADLANDLGNLLNRTVAMIIKYHGGVVHKVSETFDPAIDMLNDTLKEWIVQTIGSYMSDMDENNVTNAIKQTWELVRFANKYIDVTAPWILARDESKKAELQMVMYNLADCLRIIAILVSPYIPDGASKIFEQLGLGATPLRLQDAQWGGLADGTKVVKGDPLYPRIEVDKDGNTIIGGKKYVAAAPQEPAKPAKDFKPEIEITDFEKLDLRVGKILTAEKVPKTDKLMQLSVEIGSDVRTIVSGIAQYYTAEQLVGRNVIVIANLKPAKLRGIESKGMLLAASDGNGHLVLADAPDMASGSRVK